MPVVQQRQSVNKMLAVCQRRRHRITADPLVSAVLDCCGFLMVSISTGCDSLKSWQCGTLVRLVFPQLGFIPGVRGISDRGKRGCALQTEDRIVLSENPETTAVWVKLIYVFSAEAEHVGCGDMCSLVLGEDNSPSPP